MGPKTTGPPGLVWHDLDPNCLPSCVQGLGARARRDNLRRTWVPTGKALQALEDDKGVVIRFLIGLQVRGRPRRAQNPKPGRVRGEHASCLSLGNLPWSACCGSPAAVLVPLLCRELGRSASPSLLERGFARPQACRMPVAWHGTSVGKGGHRDLLHASLPKSKPNPDVRARSEQKDDPDEVRIQEEIKEYGDIWRLDMVDTYADLSLKTLKMFTVLPQKIDADFYFKIDDDVAVNVDAMATYLTQRRNQGNLYLARAPLRDTTCLWLISHSKHFIAGVANSGDIVC